LKSIALSSASVSGFRGICFVGEKVKPISFGGGEDGDLKILELVLI
jgi:hypothetical protein